MIEYGNAASDFFKRVNLLEVKTDAIEIRQSGIVDNVDSLRDSHRNLMDAVSVLGDMVKAQQREIQRLKIVAIVLGVGIVLLGLAMIVR